MSRLKVFLREQAAFAIVLVLVALSMLWLLIEPEHWRYGVGILTGAVFVAAAFRLVLPTAMLGGLRVRAGRLADVLIYLVIAVLMMLVTLRLHT